MQVLHDVPLRIVQDMDELYQYAEPSYGEELASLSVVVPHSDIRGLRNVLERMKAFSEYVLLTARDMASDPRSGHGESRTAMLQLQVRLCAFGLAVYRPSQLVHPRFSTSPCTAPQPAARCSKVTASVRAPCPCR